MPFLMSFCGLHGHYGSSDSFYCSFWSRDLMLTAPSVFSVSSPQLLPFTDAIFLIQLLEVMHHCSLPLQVQVLMSDYILISCFLEIRRRGSKDLLKVCAVMEGSEATADEAHPAPVQIYDIPYEEGGDSEKTAITRPELDTRPSTEYELPWEWKKEHIVKTLSGTVEFIHVFSYYSHAIKANSKTPPQNNIHLCICALLSRLCSTFQPVSL